MINLLFLYSAWMKKIFYNFFDCISLALCRQKASCHFPNYRQDLFIMENFTFCAVIYQSLIILTKIYKSTVNANPKFMQSFFKHTKVRYKLRRGPVLLITPTRSTFFSTNSVGFRGSLIWNSAPKFVKSSSSFLNSKVTQIEKNT